MRKEMFRSLKMVEDLHLSTKNYNLYLVVKVQVIALHLMFLIFDTLDKIRNRIFKVKEIDTIKLTKILLKKYNLEDVVTDVKNPEADELGIFTGGFLPNEKIDGKGELYIPEVNNILGLDNEIFPQTFREYTALKVILHELKHVAQCKEGVLTYNFFKEEYTKDIQDAEYQYEAYLNHPIEVEANKFAKKEVLKNIKYLFKKEIV